MVTFILKRMPEQTQHSRKGLGVWLGPDIQNMGVYCRGYPKGQTSSLETVGCPRGAALGPGKYEPFVWTSMRNSGKRGRLQTKALGMGTRERAFFWGHFFLTSPDTVTCLGDRFLYVQCHSIKERHIRVRTPLCWTIQIRNLKLFPALWTTVSNIFLLQTRCIHRAIVYCLSHCGSK